MSEPKDGLKKFGGFAGKQAAKGSNSYVNAVQDSVKESHRKKEILNKMYPETIKEFARLKRIQQESSSDEKPTIDDYKDFISENVSLQELIDFARKKRIDIRAITDRIDEERVTIKEKEIEEDNSTSDEFKEVAECIRNFEPLKNFRNESAFQRELTQWLKSRFPNTKIEVQRGSPRPDIVVDGIAIEVKGPTGVKELDTIHDKLMRYPRQFPNGIIIALFSVQVNDRYYEEWYKKIKDTWPNIEVIKK